MVRKDLRTDLSCPLVLQHPEDRVDLLDLCVRRIDLFLFACDITLCPINLLLSVPDLLLERLDTGSSSFDGCKSVMTQVCKGSDGVHDCSCSSMWALWWVM
jgi:hypothetical protein